MPEPNNSSELVVDITPKSKRVDTSIKTKCAIGVNPVSGVCAKPEVVNVVKQILEKRNINVTGAKDTVAIEKAAVLMGCAKGDEKCVTTNNSVKKNLSTRDNKDNSSRYKTDGPANSNRLLHNGNIDSTLSNLVDNLSNRSDREGGPVKYFHQHFQMIDFAGVLKSGKNTEGKAAAVCDRYRGKAGDTKTACKKGSKKHCASGGGKKSGGGSGNERYFKESGPNPSLYSDQPTDLAKLDMVKIIKAGFDCFGVVLNTDVRRGRGIHWFPLFCDFRKKPLITIEYFNSSGNMPMREVCEWLSETEALVNAGGYKARVITYMDHVHQADSETECGPYSIYYIYNRCLGKSRECIDESRITDDEMLAFRKQVFD